ncbi:MAG: hypothetical protein RLZ37_1951 [Actinomycetota bacterium]
MSKRFSFKRHLSSLVLAVTAVSSVSVPTTVRAGGSAEFGVDYYIAPPLVQGSYVVDFLETFNGGSEGPGECLGSYTSGGITVTISNTCTRLGGMVLFGGATTTSATPTAGGTETNFGSTSNPYTGPIRFDIDADMCYLGFWWSAGSIGNVVDFYDGDTLVLTLSSNEIMGVLDPSIEPNLQSLGLTSYPKTAWIGLPRLHTDTNADGLPDGPQPPNEPFVYMHVFAQGGLTFDRMEFSTTGNGFEFDNLVISDECQAPTDDLVRIGSVAGSNPNPSGPSSDYSGYLEHLQQVTELPNTR